MPMRTNGLDKRSIAAGILLALTLCYLLIIPGITTKLLGREDYGDWMQTKAEPRVCIINVWHIVGFKPYIGSLGSWLKTQADAYAKGLIGIHFEIASMTREEAEARLLRGLKPDVVSFMSGNEDPSRLLDLNGIVSTDSELCVDSGYYGNKLLAIPYCASGTLLLFDPNKTAGASPEEIAAAAGTPEDFKKGKAPACICDARKAGDIYRAGLTGNASYYEAIPYENGPQLVQYAGVRNDIDDYKLKYALGFIAYITGEKAQSKLCGLGLMPVLPGADAEYEQDWLKALYLSFDPYSLESCFSGQASAASVSGSSSAGGASSMILPSTMRITISALSAMAISCVTIITQ